MVSAIHSGDAVYMSNRYILKASFISLSQSICRGQNISYLAHDGRDIYVNQIPGGAKIVSR